MAGQLTMCRCRLHQNKVYHVQPKVQALVETVLCPLIAMSSMAHDVCLINITEVQQPVLYVYQVFPWTSARSHGGLARRCGHQNQVTYMDKYSCTGKIFKIYYLRSKCIMHSFKFASIYL